jgi:hypothetical protein
MHKNYMFLSVQEYCQNISQNREIGIIFEENLDRKVSSENNISSRTRQEYINGAKRLKLKPVSLMDTGQYVFIFPD